MVLEQQEQENEPRADTSQDNNKLLFKQQQTEPSTHKGWSKYPQTEPSQTEPSITNTIEPSIKEIERFLLFLNKRFALGLKFDNITILISQAHPNTMGYFSPSGFKNTTQILNGIVLNSIYLKEHPYETIAHELAHYHNNQNGVKDCSRNQYHNKQFKKVAELLLLECDARGNKGYNMTRETPAFLEMINNEFMPNPSAFHINQIAKSKTPKTPSRLYKWVCECGFIIRCGDRTLQAECKVCNSVFKLENKIEDNEDGESN